MCHDPINFIHHNHCVPGWNACYGCARQQKFQWIFNVHHTHIIALCVHLEKLHLEEQKDGSSGDTANLTIGKCCNGWLFVCICLF